MSPLRELQARFRAALLDGDERGLASEVEPDGLGVSARLAVYRHHVLTSLATALEATFPVVCRLVDRRFFGWLADHYVRVHPPAGPCLDEYGESFADFVARFPACARLPWLADVARLEWAINTARHAADAAPLTPAHLGRIAPAELESLVLRLDPSVTLLRSPWPIDAIWRANQPEADPAVAVDLDEGGVRLEIRRLDDDVAFRPLPPGPFALREALALRRTLRTAVDTAVAADPAMDVAAEIRALLDERLLAAW
jgi:hypothetical protein